MSVDETLKQALDNAKELCEWIRETPHQRGSINGKAAQVLHAISAIEQHKVRMLTDEELAECCGRAVPNSAAMTWMRRSIRKFAEKNGLTIGEHG